MRILTLLAAILLIGAPALAQHPTATQPAQLSVFGGLTGDYTGLDGGKNLGLTAGLDLGLPTFSRLVRPVAEFRGTFPIDGGKVDSQRYVLGGLRADIWLGHRLHPYADILLGRGEMKYGDGYFFQNQDYILTTTWMESFGGGLDYDISHNLRIKLDAQMQHWGAAPVDGGSIYAKTGTVGVVYVFNFNRHGIH